MAWFHRSSTRSWDRNCQSAGRLPDSRFSPSWVRRPASKICRLSMPAHAAGSVPVSGLPPRKRRLRRARRPHSSGNPPTSPHALRLTSVRWLNSCQEAGSFALWSLQTPAHLLPIRHAVAIFWLLPGDCEDIGS